MAMDPNLRLFMEPTPTPMEKDLYDKFVEEYIKDYNPFEACARVGFAPSFAVEYAKILMVKPYIVRRIAEEKRKKSEKTPEAQREEHRALVIAHTIDLIHNAPHQTRATALKLLAQIEGFIDPTERGEEELEKLVTAFKAVAKELPE